VICHSGFGAGLSSLHDHLSDHSLKGGTFCYLASVPRPQQLLNMEDLIVDTFPEYNLRKDDLLDYLRGIFPKHAAFVSVSVSASWNELQLFQLKLMGTDAI
jgi:hypothetical protein